MLRKTGNDIQI